MTAKLTEREAAALGLIDKPARKRGIRKEASGRYRTCCVTCGQQFTTIAAENRHLLESLHCRYEVVL